MNFLYFLIVGALAGWLAGIVWKGSGFGLLGNIITCIVGGLVGGWAAAEMGIGGGGLLFQILVAAGGALILIALLRVIRGG